MDNRTKTFVSVLLLILYGTLALVSVPLHFHQDVLLSSGTGNHAYAPHADAQHCAHQAIDLHDDCTLCSITSQFHYFNVISNVRQTDPVSNVYSETHQRTPQLFLHSALTRRGPPAFLA